MEEAKVIIGGVEYVKKSDAKMLSQIENSNLMSGMIGKYVIVRSYNEGVNFGKVVAADKTGIILSDCRRLWHHYPLNTKLSWYEGVALSGLAAQSKISAPIPLKIIVEKYSVILTTEIAAKSIMEFPIHGQN
jgi:hypothetical protein